MFFVCVKFRSKFSCALNSICKQLATSNGECLTLGKEQYTNKPEFWIYIWAQSPRILIWLLNIINLDIENSDIDLKKKHWNKFFTVEKQWSNRKRRIFEKYNGNAVNRAQSEQISNGSSLNYPQFESKKRNWRK